MGKIKWGDLSDPDYRIWYEREARQYAREDPKAIEVIVAAMTKRFFAQRQRANFSIYGWAGLEYNGTSFDRGECGSTSLMFYDEAQECMNLILDLIMDYHNCRKIPFYAGEPRSPVWRQMKQQQHDEILRQEAAEGR